MKDIQDLTFINRIPSVNEFQALRTDAKWEVPDEASTKEALSKTLFSICVETSEPQTIAMGRVVGDGRVQLFVTDVIVRKDWQKIGVGSKIMQLLMEHIQSVAVQGTFIGLFAAAGRNRFYERFGFITRPNDKFGPGMMFLSEDILSPS